MIESVLIMLIMGAFLGIGLGFASEKFHVEADPAFDDVLNMLPGLNCGACGYPGCSGFAEALVDDVKVKPTLCRPASQNVTDKISYYLEDYFESKGVIEAKKSVSGKTIGKREE